MLAEGQTVKAAKFAKSAVQTLEKGSEPSLLAEALMSGTLDEAAAREAGADVFLRKPEGIGSLVSTVTGLLDDRDQDA